MSVKMDNILNWNIRGFNSNFEELKLLLSESDPAVVALQECKLEKSQLSFRGYTPLYMRDDASGSDAALLIRENILFTKIDLNSNVPAVAATVTLEKTFTIVSIYLNPNSPVNKESLQALFDQLPRPFLVVGDFNAHSPTWGDPRLDTRGKMVEDLLQNNNLILLNGKQSTFIHSAYNTPSSIDLAVTSPSISVDFTFETHDDLCGSDHFPIFIKYQSNLNNSTELHYNFNKADWNLFRDLCTSSIDGELLKSKCPTEDFTKHLMDAANSSIPKHENKSNRKRVPWFTADCKRAIRNRKKAQRKYFNIPTDENLINFRREKAKCKYIIRQAKASSWKDYVSTINDKTSTKSVWKKIKKIKGKDTTPKTHLKKNGEIITDKKEHVNYLAETFANNSSTNNYSSKFQKMKENKEKHTLNFSSNNEEPYNKPFILSELTDSLKKSNLSAAGPDGVYYQFLTHLPDTCLNVLLQIFNNIWKSGELPSAWKEATVIPIPKPNKDTSNPTNYRPIALTSCLCKTLERMVNARLVWVLESKNLLSKYQCGFREDHSTIDHLVRFETFIREAFARKKQVLAVFFDLEKAYDTTWKYGILTDLYNLDFRGRLPQLIENFLSGRNFKVKDGSQYSDSFKQENGVPQGSILSPILFNLKINEIMKSVSNNANASLFVDDFAIYIEGKHLQHIERTMQLCINKVQKWVSENGFKFSVSKTTCVHFHRQRIYKEPLLKLDGENIPVKDEAKFLGIIFDKKLSFKSHIMYLKRKCQKALNILRVVGHTDWGADRTTLLKLYRCLIRSKLDYGCVVYGSAKKSVLKLLDPIHHQGLRLALGAFRTSPVKSLYAEAGEPSLEHRRIKLSLNYSIKLKSLPKNPCHDSIYNSSTPDFYENKKFEPCLGARIQEHFQNSEINTEHIDDQNVQKTPPWQQFNMRFDTTLTKFPKNETNEIVFKKEYLSMKENYVNHYEIFTDGSKQDAKVSAACFIPSDPSNPLSTRLRDDSSIFNAELQGILLALGKIKNMSKSHKKFVIYTDSLSALLAIQNRNFKSKNVRRVFNTIKGISPKVCISFVWIPSHVGITGNENADRLAKAALFGTQNTKLFICWSDLKPKIDKYINDIWQRDWDGEVQNKLHHILPYLKENLQKGNTRKEQTVMTRLRIGHTWITHSFLLKREEQPYCYACDSLYTVQHILVECLDFKDTREKYYKTTNMFGLFRDVDPSMIFEYLKEIGVFNKI